MRVRSRRNTCTTPASKAPVSSARPKNDIGKGARVCPAGGADGAPCSGRGACDTARGVCRCDAGYAGALLDQSLALLDDASSDEQQVLGAIGYHRNRAVLHTDTALLPRRTATWAAWNYERSSTASGEKAAVCLHYLINKLQPLPFETPVVVSLNPTTEPRADTVHGEYDYAHPVFDAAAIAAQSRVPMLQGCANTWFCGAWTRYGFHEDGLMSGLAVVDGLRAHWQQTRSAPADQRAAA
jgi:predicted NAD/FAD-binding protein